MRVASYDIVFQEIPGEVTLALNISGCPCHCPGCHSQHLWTDTGEILNETLLAELIGQYKGLITCVAFMGGDQDPEYVSSMAELIKLSIAPSIKTAWYSGRVAFPSKDVFDYVKLGPYIESLGGLKSENTNQHLYKRIDHEWSDITASFHRTTL